MTKPIHEKYKDIDEKVERVLEINGHEVMLLKPKPTTPEKRARTYRNIALILIENEKQKRSSK